MGSQLFLATDWNIRIKKQCEADAAQALRDHHSASGKQFMLEFLNREISQDVGLLEILESQGWRFVDRGGEYFVLEDLYDVEYYDNWGKMLMVLWPYVVVGSTLEFILGNSDSFLWTFEADGLKCIKGKIVYDGEQDDEQYLPPPSCGWIWDEGNYRLAKAENK